MLVLPNDVLVRFFSHLEVPEIACAGQVSKRWNSAVNEEALWEEIAAQRYGSRVAHATKHLYHQSFKLMVRDENRIGAMPTLEGLWKSSWRHNNAFVYGSLFYCCLVTGVKWDRPNNKLLIYLDARGEADLRPPETSGLWVRDENGRIHTLHDRLRPSANGSFQLQDLVGIPRNVTPYEFESLLPSQRRQQDQQRRGKGNGGRYKGVLRIDANLCSRSGSYQFCYANARPSMPRDYEECTLFSIPKNGGLSNVFTSFSLQNETPFDLDTPESEHERWWPHLNDTSAPKNFLGPWPECVGMTGEECREMLLSLNPDLSVEFVRPGQRTHSDYCLGRVRVYLDNSGCVRCAPVRG